MKYPLVRKPRTKPAVNGLRMKERILAARRAKLLAAMTIGLAEYAGQRLTLRSSDENCQVESHFTTHLDADGCPVVTDAIMERLEKL